MRRSLIRCLAIVASMLIAACGTSPAPSAPGAALEKASAAGRGAACRDLGTQYLGGLGVTRDEGRAATLFDRACAAGELQGCSDLGALYGQGRAAALYEKACRG